MSAQNKELVRRSIEAVNDEGPDAIDRFLAVDWIGWDSRDGSKASREDSKKEQAVILSGFPDARVTVEDLVAEGDKVASRLTVSGTHTGEYFGIAPTGKRVTFSMLNIDRVASGKIAESWTESSGLGFHYQLTGKQAPSLKETAGH